MAFGMIRAEHFVLRTLPPIASLNPIILVEGNRRNLLRLWLRTKVRVLRLDLLHLLRIRLLRLGPSISLRVLLAGCWRSGCLRRLAAPLHPLPALLSLLLGAGRRPAGRLTGNIRSRLGGACRFLLGLPTLSRTPLIRRAALLHRSAFLCGPLLRFGCVRARRCFGRVLFFSGVLLLRW